MIDHLITRIWENLISRPAGPMKFRFLMQPAMAIFLAVRSGLKDYREGKPAYFWALLWIGQIAGSCCVTAGNPSASFLYLQSYSIAHISYSSCTGYTLSKRLWLRSL